MNGENAGGCVRVNSRFRSRGERRKRSPGSSGRGQKE